MCMCISMNWRSRIVIMTHDLLQAVSVIGAHHVIRVAILRALCYSLGYSHKTWIFRISRSSGAVSVMTRRDPKGGYLGDWRNGITYPTHRGLLLNFQQILVCLVFANTTVVVETSNEPWCDRFHRATSLGKMFNRYTQNCQQQASRARMSN